MKKLFFTFLFFIPLVGFSQDKTVPVEIQTIDAVETYIAEDCYGDTIISPENTGIKILDSMNKVLLDSEILPYRYHFKKLGNGKYFIKLPNTQHFNAEIYDSHSGGKYFSIYHSANQIIKSMNANSQDTLRIKIEVEPSTYPDMRISNINFNIGESILTYYEKNADTMTGILAYMKDCPRPKLKITAHTDSTEKNPEELSKKRALVVKNYLVEKGIDPKRIEIEYFGNSSPMVPNDSEQNKALNRRVTFHIISK